MKKFKILIPVYNDWDSVFKLLQIIDSEISVFDHEFSVYIVDDASTEKMQKTKFNYKNLKSVDVIKMKKNQGHTRCNATGLKYLSEKKNFDYLIFMDGDGEDRPEELVLLVRKVLKEKISTVARRVKRSEGLIFTSLYRIHRLIALIFTGKNMNFGNYCCLIKEDVLLLSNKGSLWCNFPSTIKKFISKLESIPCERGKRYVQPSKMSFFKLIMLSFSMLAVFKYQVLLRSIIISLFFLLFSQNFFLFSFSMEFILILFTMLVFVVSKKESLSALNSSGKNIGEISNIYTT